MSSLSAPGQGELKYRASKLIRIRPQPAPVRINDGPADRQPHFHSAGLRGVECLENALDTFRIDARPRIAHRHEDAICPALLSADQQLSRPLVDRAQRFDRAQDQVQDNLLHLDAIPLNGKQPLREAGLNRDSILGNCASRQNNNLIDRLIEIKTILSRRCFLDLITDPTDDVSGSIGVAYDTAKRFPDLAEVWR